MNGLLLFRVYNVLLFSSELLFLGRRCFLNAAIKCSGVIDANEVRGDGEHSYRRLFRQHIGRSKWTRWRC